MWDRIRYTAWAPIYDAVVGVVSFDSWRRLSIQSLNLQPGQRVLAVGAGTGLDLAFFPPGVETRLSTSRPRCSPASQVARPA